MAARAADRLAVPIAGVDLVGDRRVRGAVGRPDADRERTVDHDDGSRTPERWSLPCGAAPCRYSVLADVVLAVEDLRSEFVTTGRTTTDGTTDH